MVSTDHERSPGTLAGLEHILDAVQQARAKQPSSGVDGRTEPLAAIFQKSWTAPLRTSHPVSRSTQLTSRDRLHGAATPAGETRKVRSIEGRTEHDNEDITARTSFIDRSIFE
jgi:hypothetical protein